jgi:hypothetical protein
VPASVRRDVPPGRFEHVDLEGADIIQRADARGAISAITLGSGDAR